MIKHTWLTVRTTSCQQIQDNKNYLTTAQLNRKTLSYIPFYKMHPDIRILKFHIEYKSTSYHT